MMILRQKKKIGTGIEMEENSLKGKKGIIEFFLPELLCIIITGIGTGLVSFFKGMSLDMGLSYVVVAVLGVAILGYRLRKEYFLKELSYDNRRNIKRFWLYFAGALALSFACVFLPGGCWPMVPAFVLLSLFSSIPVGIVSASILVMIPTLLSGEGIILFFVYLISGIFAICLFCPVKDDIRVGMPLFLSMVCLLICESAGIILTANSRPNFEMFILIIVNIVISSILLLGIVRTYLRRVVYYYRDSYLYINDTENPILAQIRENSRVDYKKSIHTTYFCERIADKLGCDVDAVKCAAYYHVLGKDIEKVMVENDFPPAARTILNEYMDVKGINGRKVPIRTKEVAVLYSADTIVGSIIQLIEKSKDKQLDYTKIIEMIFGRFENSGVFAQCDISIKDLGTMKRIFMEEKLYYDFLR